MSGAQESVAERKSRFSAKFFWIVLTLVVIEEATPFVPVFGLVAVVGLFLPGIFLWLSRQSLAYVDRVRGTHLSNRLPPSLDTATASSAEVGSREHG